MTCERCADYCCNVHPLKISLQCHGRAMKIWRTKYLNMRWGNWKCWLRSKNSYASNSKFICTVLWLFTRSHVWAQGLGGLLTATSLPPPTFPYTHTHNHWSDWASKRSDSILSSVRCHPLGSLVGILFPWLHCWPIVPREVIGLCAVKSTILLKEPPFLGLAYILQFWWMVRP